MERALFSRTRRSRAAGAEAGFSLVELLLVLALGGTLLATSIIMTRSGVTSFKASGALDSVRGQLHVAREQAISRQRTVRLTVSDTKIDLFEVPPDPDDDEVKIGTVMLPGDLKFQRLETGDARPSDSWCAAGATTPVLYTSDLAEKLRFNSDGSLTDDTGALVSGCLYLGETGKLTTARAISIFGSTGALRPFKWNGDAWIR